MKQKVTMIGLGFVGMTLASYLGSKNIPITGIDSDREKIRNLLKAKTNFYEPNLQRYLKKALKLSMNLKTEISDDITSFDFIFITVGTPLNEHGKINLDCVKSVAKSISRYLPNSSNQPTIVVKSTVTPGTTMQVVNPILEGNSLKEGVDFNLLTNPEFLREGSAMNDTISPHAIIIGGSNKKSIKKLVKFYEKVYPKKQPIVETNNVTAEMIKYANNAFLATKISFINSMANICQKIEGTNIDDIAKMMGLDPRISKLFLKAGPGFGGSCFPKDLQGLINFSNENGYNPVLLNAVKKINESQVDAILDIIIYNIKSLKGKKIGILGLSFKENTDDIRESVSIKMIKKLLRYDCDVLVHDPKAIPNTEQVFKNKISYCKKADDVFNKTHCIVLLTPWKEYQTLDETNFLKMAKPFIIDTRRILKINNKKIKCIYFGVGN